MSTRVKRHILRLSRAASAALDTSTEVPCFCWNDGRSGLSFRAYGSAWSSEDSGGFIDAAFTRSAIVEHTASDDDAELAGSALPMALHAVPFGPTALGAANGIWRGWPDGRSWLPERLVVRTRDGAAYAISQCVVGSGESPERTARAMQARGGEHGLRADGLARAEFVERVIEARAAIRDQRFRKVVLARSETVTATKPFDPVLQFEALAASSPDAVAFAWLHGAVGAWVGATPEVLARLTNGQLETSAVAGTALASLDPDGRGMLADPKTRKEHDLVVEAMRRALQPCVRALTIASEPGPRRSERLVHLETPMRGELCASEFVAACERLHPTPALGGTPRDAALAWLARHEGLDRGYFGAPIGWSAPNGDGVLAVGIRSALLVGNEAVLFAGAGIVAESNADAEWSETAHKLELGRTTLRTAPEPLHAEDSP